MPTPRDETTAPGWIVKVISRVRKQQTAPTEEAPLPDGILDLLPDPTVVVDADDQVRAANRAARDRFDIAEGAGLAETLLAPDHRDAHRAHLGRVMDGEETETQDRVAIQAEGSEARVTLSVRAIPDTEPPLFAVGFGTPAPATSETAQAVAEADARRRTLRAVLDALPDPIVAVSRAGRVLFRNRASTSEISQGDGSGIGTLSAPQWQAADAAMRSGAPVVGEEAIGDRIRLTTRIPVRARTGEVVGLVAVSRDVTAQKADLARLDDARRAAEAAARAGGEVLATTSHEVRTLMSGVTGMTALLLGTDLDADQRDFVETIRTSGASLLRVVNDVLDLSKMDAGMLEIERSPYDLRQTLQAALAVVAQQAHAKGLVLSGTVDSRVPAQAVGDSTRIQQVLANLLTNAVKFTDQGSVQVHVEPVDDGSALAFSVRDTGVGIAPERLDAVFEPFAQADASTARTHGGTGLGLTICRRLATMMGGELTAESAPGGGSVFRFTVALAVPSAAPISPDAWGTLAAPEANEPEVDDSEPIPDSPPIAPPVGAATSAPPPEEVAEPTPEAPASHSPPAPVPRADPPAPEAPPAAPEAAATVPEADASDEPGRSKVMDMGSMLPSASVLLVEDDKVMQKVTSMTLRRLGYRPTVVDNGRKGVIAARARRYDVILMDVMMPVMDGLEATREIRADTSLEAQPAIVMLTANAMKGDRERGVEAGCDAYLTKPVDSRELAATIERAIREKEAAPVDA